jgi:hypothetical protein
MQKEYLKKKNAQSSNKKKSSKVTMDHRLLMIVHLIAYKILQSNPSAYAGLSFRAH